MTQIPKSESKNSQSCVPLMLGGSPTVRCGTKTMKYFEQPVYTVLSFPHSWTQLDCRIGF
jgi:hypothetical protein